MTTPNAKPLNDRVQDYVRHWEMEVKQKLRAAKVEIFTLSNPYDRAEVKTEIETHSAVLDLLQGKRKYEIPTITEQREEIADLKSRLRDAEERRDEAFASLSVHKKIIRDLKEQLHARIEKLLVSGRKAESTMQELHLKLPEVQELNQDLMFKMKVAQKHLQPQTRDSTVNRHINVCTNMESLVIEKVQGLQLSGAGTESPYRWFSISELSEREMMEQQRDQRRKRSCCVEMCKDDEGREAKIRLKEDSQQVKRPCI